MKSCLAAVLLAFACLCGSDGAQALDTRFEVREIKLSIVRLRQADLLTNSEVEDMWGLTESLQGGGQARYFDTSARIKAILHKAGKRHTLSDRKPVFDRHHQRVIDSLLEIGRNLSGDGTGTQPVPQPPSAAMQPPSSKGGASDDLQKFIDDILEQSKDRAKTKEAPFGGPDRPKLQ